jgi:hypothetical protein
MPRNSSIGCSALCEVAPTIPLPSDVAGQEAQRGACASVTRVARSTSRVSLLRCAQCPSVEDAVLPCHRERGDGRDQQAKPTDPVEANCMRRRCRVLPHRSPHVCRSEKCVPFGKGTAAAVGTAHGRRAHAEKMQHQAPHSSHHHVVCSVNRKRQIVLCCLVRTVLQWDGTAEEPQTHRHTAETKQTRKRNRVTAHTTPLCGFP